VSGAEEDSLGRPMTPEQKEVVIKALRAGAKELGFAVNTWSSNIERVQDQGEWGKGLAKAIQRDIERAEAVQDQLIDAIVTLTEQETPNA